MLHRRRSTKLPSLTLMRGAIEAGCSGCARTATGAAVPGSVTSFQAQGGESGGGAGERWYIRQLFMHGLARHASGSLSAGEVATQERREGGIQVSSNTITTGIGFAQVLWASALMVLSACGGGGGGGTSQQGTPPPPSAALMFTPTTATVSAQAGSSGMATLTATPAPGLPSPLYVKITSSPTVVAPNVGFTANASGTYTLTLQSSTSLTQGAYTGNLSVAVCSDAACTTPVAGSPVSLPYAFTITAPPPPPRVILGD